MSPDSPATPDVKELIALAKRFADRKLFDEAAELFQVALRLDPKDLGIRLALARIRKLQKLHLRQKKRDVNETLREQLRRKAIDASHFVGLARLYVEKGDDFRALECLDIARMKDDVSADAYEIAAEIHLRHKDFDKAAEYLERARRYDPFDRAVAERLGQVEYERRQFQSAIEATMDGFLLLPPTDDEGTLRLRRRIRTLRQLLGWDPSRVVALLREREENLHTAFDRLEWRRERFREEIGLVEPAAGGASTRLDLGGRLDLAGRLRRMESWTHFTDEQVFKLSAAVTESTLERGGQVFAHGSAGTDIYLLEEGEISIQRPTPYGTFSLALLKAGSMFGEVNFVTHGERTGDAVALQPSKLLRFEGEALTRLADGWNEFGVQLYWGLWHSLATKLRSTNEQLKTFFSADKQPENFVRLRRGAPIGAAGPVEVASDEKIQLFREQGLTGKELATLATFSRERRFGAGSYLFEEGDQGLEMYVVLEGRVMISKYIPGAGEEALAILERGDFFGEMSLIDGELRSADARAHGGPVTVLALDQSTIQEMLALDPQASLDFLKLLCRLIAKRLREIDEKVIGWRILSGERNESALA